MKPSIQLMARLYALLLKLYPRAYQVEYGEELQLVFKLALDEAAEQNGFAALWIILRELGDLPQAIILAYWRERRKQGLTLERDTLLTFEAGSWRETMMALAPFLLFGAFPTFLGYLRVNSSIPHWLDVVIALSMLGLLLSLFVIGVVKRFPRWFLPYIGLPLPLFSAYIFLELIASPPYEVWLVSTAPWLLRSIASQGLLWTGLLVAGIFVVFITGILPPLRPFYWRIRGDWTLLSFTLYGAALFALVFTFDDYRNEEPYKIASMLLLAAGGWLYLQGAYPWQRFLALFTGLTLAMTVAAAGKAILYSGLNWPYPRHFTWQT